MVETTITKTQGSGIVDLTLFFGDNDLTDWRAWIGTTIWVHGTVTYQAGGANDGKVVRALFNLQRAENAAPAVREGWFLHQPPAPVGLGGYQLGPPPNDSQAGNPVLDDDLSMVYRVNSLKPGGGQEVLTIFVRHGDEER